MRRTILWIALGAGGALLLAALALWLYLQGTYRFSYPDAVTYPVRGIDISHHQGDIDWAKLPQQDIRFVYLKASEGGDWTDPTFADNIQKAQKQGLAVGAYHYFTLCAPGVVQARNFLRGMPPGMRLDLPYAIDLEYVGNCSARPGGGRLSRELKAFIAIVTARLHRAPVIYSTESFFTDYLDADPAFAKYPLWVRNLYGESAWARGRKVLFRQFASHARLDGIKGAVDLDLFAGSKREFAELIKTGTLPP